MGFGVCSVTDPIFISPTLKTRISAPDTSTKARRDAPISPSEATGVFVIAGESLAANATASLYTPSNASKVDNIDILSGMMFAAVDPLAGCSGAGGHWAGRMADKLIAAGKYQRIILVPVGVAAAKMADWRPGGLLNPLMQAALMRLAAISMPATAILWQLGANDNFAGTSQSVFAAGLNDLIWQQRSFGYDCPWLLARNTLYENAISAPIQAALASVINGDDVISGADTDSLTGGTNRADGVHFTATGADSAATLWANAIVASL